MTSITLSRISLTPVFWVIFVLAFSSSEIAAGNRDQELISITDLTRVSRLANEGARVLMIEFSSEDWDYSRILGEEFLKPMLRNDEYNQKVVIRYLSLSDNDTLVDFYGSFIDQRIDSGLKVVCDL